jgi:hypothetical protein
MFVGYSVNDANDVYRIINLDIKSIIQSCDIIWLNEYNTLNCMVFFVTKITNKIYTPQSLRRITKSTVLVT